MTGQATPAAGYADLHVHSCYSDGSDTPMRVAERACKLGFSAISLTDHDTVEGVAEAEAAAREHGMEHLSGVEISARFQSIEVHVLGYGINSGNQSLLAALSELRHGRDQRAVRMIEKLAELGIVLDMDEIRGEVRRGVVGRMHLARKLHELGHAKTVQDAFDRYIGRGKPAFVRKEALSVEAAVALIHTADGLAFLAHPGIGKDVEKKLTPLLTLGFDGIEVYHTRHTPGQVSNFTMLAVERDLLLSGGSDCHGEGKREQPDMGKVRLPQYHVLRIQERLCARARSG
jgi:predicted metal-dependent phosphoesterase TrpH